VPLNFIAKAMRSEKKITLKHRILSTLEEGGYKIQIDTCIKATFNGLVLSLIERDWAIADWLLLVSPFKTFTNKSRSSEVGEP
jgi:hypothetical protein